MRVLRSFAFVAVVLSLVGLSACGNVHPASEARDAAPVDDAKAQPADKKAVAPAKKGDEDATDLNPLNLEVTALETLKQFKFNRSQLERLKKIAPATMHKPAAPRPMKVGKEYKKALQNLHEALLEDNEVRISDLSAALDDLREKESPDFDEVEITDAARRHAAEVLRGLSPRQVAGYLTEYADEFPDPAEKLTDAFEQIRKLPASEWEALRDEVAGQVAWLVAGLDSAGESKLHDRATALLDRVRRMKDDEYVAKRKELDKAVQELVGKAGPTDVIRHFVERSLAELLSNPRLAVAVEGLLKKAE
jgi:hypothetical protein